MSTEIILLLFSNLDAFSFFCVIALPRASNLC
jgi:hypothetical protein